MTPTQFPHSTVLSSFADFPALGREFLALQKERDPELRDEGLFSLARRLERRGAADSALLLYRQLADSSGPSRERAVAASEALQGRGSFGARAEIWIRNFSSQVADPANLFAMGVAGSVFRMAQFGTLARLRSLSVGGGSARLFAGLAGLSLEAPAFALSAKAGAELLGRHQDWSRAAWGRDLATAYLTLAGLRGAGALGRLGLAGLPASFQASPLLQFGVGQGSMLGGIVLAHSLEAAVGLRRPQAAGEALFDGLATLLQFQVAGRLSRAAFGENFAAWERRLDLQSESLSRPEPLTPLGSGRTELFQPALALEGPSDISPPAPRPLFSNQMQMSGKDPFSRESRPSSESGTRPTVTIPAEGASLPEAQALLDGIGSPEAGLRAFLNSLPVAATAARIKGENGLLRIVAANAEFLRQFGHTERELAQHPLTHYLRLKSAPIVAARLWTMQRSGVFKATDVDFQARHGYQKVWVSGLVRSAYGEDFAFTFYQPRSEDEVAAPPPPAALKAFQMVDTTTARKLELGGDGFYELRSLLELSLLLTNGDSPVLRFLKLGDLRLRTPESEAASLRSLAPALERVLSHWAPQLHLPAGRILTINDLHFVNGGFSFALSAEGRPATTSQPRIIAAAERTPLPGSVRTPVPRPKAGGLLETVQKALAGITSRDDNGDGSKPPAK